MLLFEKIGEFSERISSVKFRKIMSNQKEIQSNQKKGKDLGFKSCIASVKENEKALTLLHLYNPRPLNAPMELQLKKLDLVIFQV